MVEKSNEDQKVIFYNQTSILVDKVGKVWSSEWNVLEEYAQG